MNYNMNCLSLSFIDIERKDNYDKVNLQSDMEVKGKLAVITGSAQG